MDEDIQIRAVHVEFLRPGPPHNQLLSPLTAYLAIAGDAGAGVIHVPYEHAAFERRLRDLRYETGDSDQREQMLHETGTEVGRLLGAVPGLPGALTVDPTQSGTLVHLRLTLSAAELALLPFEIAKTPISATVTADSWLSLQTRPPVCVTRNIRTVCAEAVIWPCRPRILFIAGDPDNVPYKEHRKALLDAIEPFRYPDKSYEPEISPDKRRERWGDLLTILVEPSLAEVLREARRTPYTHVHILAHGDEIGTDGDSYGIVLGAPSGGIDVVSGDQLAGALTSVGHGQIHRPSVITVASCDSANGGNVVIPGASFAHALHQAGVPLVIASQFPLSKDGSVPFAETLYKGFLWGEHPLVLLQQLRTELHALFKATWHDWASVVAYEALPQALPRQLDAVRYYQAKRAIDTVLENIDRAVQKTSDQEQRDETLRRLDPEIEQAIARLPLRGQYSVECTGIRASSRKRLAQAAFVLGREAVAQSPQWWRDPYELLESAWQDYDLAARGLLVSEGEDTQKVATLHWVLVQVESLALVLGKASDSDRWHAAKLCAEFHREHPSQEQRAWAHGSLAELWLIRLADTRLTEEKKRKKAKARALRHVHALCRIYPLLDKFPVRSTRRQLERYVTWWADPQFREQLATRSGNPIAPWHPDLVAVAEQMIALLRREASSPSGASTPSGNSSSPSPAPGGSTGGAGKQPSTSRARRQRAEALSGRVRPRTGPFFDIQMLPAEHGDCIWIEYGEGRTHRWLVDCGTRGTASALLDQVEALPESERHLELFVLSHIDSDHIGGALPFFRAFRKGLTVGDVWFNGWRHISAQLGSRQGEMFSTAIQEFRLPWNSWSGGQAIVVGNGNLPTHTLPGGMKLTLLSPTPTQLKKLAPVWTRELKRHGLAPGAHVDYSRMLKSPPTTSTDIEALADERFGGDAGAPNGSSIAMLAEFKGARVLLAADAHAPVLVESIRKLLGRRAKRLRLDAFKVSHHGSQNNVSKELIELLDCRHYLLSTNGAHFSHPDRQAIARIVRYGGRRPTLHFNYHSAYNKVWSRRDLQERYGFQATYPDADTSGASISLLPRR